MPLFPEVLDPESLDGRNGFQIDGVGDEASGYTVAIAGDVNGDSIDDLIIGTAAGGSSYVVFGVSDRPNKRLDLQTLDGSNGFRISATQDAGPSRPSVASAGDVNGDGIDDLIVAASDASGTAGYVIFGSTAGTPATVDAASLDGSNGFRIHGLQTGTGACTVASAGDLNGDGIGDIALGHDGSGYVVFGRADGLGPAVDLAALDGSNGFRIASSEGSISDRTSIASAGDVNGDGFDDLVIGGQNYSPWHGSSFVVFGKADGHAAELDLAMLDGSNGFRVPESFSGDLSGFSVASAGDINGDGFDDILIGRPYGGEYYQGASLVVLGKGDGFSATFEPSDSNSLYLGDGYFYLGAGLSVCSAGDINGDGLDDMIVGAPGGVGGYSAVRGRAYVVFGSTDASGRVDLNELDGSNGFRITATFQRDHTGTSVAGAGDVNGDGFDDILVGAPGAGPSRGAYGGESYVVFGHATGPLDRAGSAQDDTLSGGEWNDRFRGLGGSDWIRSGAGADRVVGGSGGDRLAGEDGDDVVRGGTGNDALEGGAGADVLRGGGQRDLISGGAGNDILSGNDGADTLQGGFGRDVFQMDPRQLASGSVDLILDFVAGTDTLALDEDAFTAFSAGASVLPTQFASGPGLVSAQTPEQRLIYDSTTGALYYDPDGVGGLAALQFAVLGSDVHPGISAADFVVVG